MEDRIKEFEVLTKTYFNASRYKPSNSYNHRNYLVFNSDIYFCTCPRIKIVVLSLQ